MRSQALPTPASDRADEEKRSVRFNDARRTIVARLPPLSYADGALRARGAGQGDGLGRRDPPRPAPGRRPGLGVGPHGGASGSSRVPLVVAHVPFEVLATRVDAAR